VRRVGWSRLPRKFLTSWSTHLSAEDGHTPTGTTSRPRASSSLQRIGFNTDSAAVQLGVSLSWGLPFKTERNGASSQLGYRWRLWKRNHLSGISNSKQARTERSRSEHAQPAPDPDATTWSAIACHNITNNVLARSICSHTPGGSVRAPCRQGVESALSSLDTTTYSIIGSRAHAQEN
jgi:hypothetical protein